jgi:hypothetical protein
VGIRHRIEDQVKCWPVYRQLADRLTVTPHVFIDPTSKRDRDDTEPVPEAGRP